MEMGRRGEGCGRMGDMEREGRHGEGGEEEGCTSTTARMPAGDVDTGDGTARSTSVAGEGGERGKHA